MGRYGDGNGDEDDDGDGDGEGEGEGGGESIIWPLLMIPSWALAVAYRLPIGWPCCTYVQP